MATRARKLDKSVHSTEQAVLCELMIKARKTADLTQHELAKRLRRPQSSSPNTRAVSGESTSWNS
jgi:hypothetical protein